MYCMRRWSRQLGRSRQGDLSKSQTYQRTSGGIQSEGAVGWLRYSWRCCGNVFSLFYSALVTQDFPALHRRISKSWYPRNAFTWSLAPSYKRYLQRPFGCVGGGVPWAHPWEGRCRSYPCRYWSTVWVTFYVHFPYLTVYTALLLHQAFLDLDVFRRDVVSTSGQVMIPRHWWR